MFSITFHSFEDGVVTLQMRGACQGCPSSTATLKMGIENMLRHYIPEVREVISRSSIRIGNKAIVLTLLGAIGLGLVLPGVGVPPPLPLFLKTNTSV